MEKRNRIEDVNDEFLLPEGIIQHIQSFLSGKEAAQTTILSKSWYDAWLTRPNLDFDQQDFGIGSNNPGDEVGFWKFAEKTMQRYEELNLKIDSFRLCIRCNLWESALLADKLVVKASKMGATDLSFEMWSFSMKIL